MAHVEIPVRDLDRAIAFYEAVFDLACGPIVTVHGSRMVHFPFIEGQDGASAALAEGDVYVPGLSGAVVYFNVDDVDVAIARAVAAGGAVLFPKTASGEDWFVAEIRDSEGNRIAFQALRRTQ